MLELDCRSSNAPCSTLDTPRSTARGTCQANGEPLVRRQSSMVVPNGATGAIGGGGCHGALTMGNRYWAMGHGPWVREWGMGPKWNSKWLIQSGSVVVVGGVSNKGSKGSQKPRD